MARACDHLSVGVVIGNQAGEILLIERARLPWGWACVSGHVDEDVNEAGQPLWSVAARREVQEEVGLELGEMREVGHGVKANSCRREDGQWHEWAVFEATSTGEVSIEQSEVKRWMWANEEQIHSLALRTREWEKGLIGEQDWREKPGLEPVWQQWFEEMGIGGAAVSLNALVGGTGTSILEP